jgi:hypothetical protein
MPRASSGIVNTTSAAFSPPSLASGAHRLDFPSVFASGPSVKDFPL